eukprot:g1159.t1
MDDIVKESNQVRDTKDAEMRSRGSSKSLGKKERKTSTRQFSKAEEEQLLGRLDELVDDSGGLKSEPMILTLVMIMREQHSPLVQSRLLDIIFSSNSRIQQKMIEANMFLSILHHWLEKNMKVKETKEVLLKIIKVLENLPLSKQDIREIRLKIQKVATTFSDQEVKGEASKLFEQWEKKRKTTTNVSGTKRTQIKNKLPRLDQRSIQKVGKVCVTRDPAIKKPKSKIRRHRSGPLSSSEIIEKRELRELSASIKMASELCRIKSQSSDSKRKITVESVNKTGEDFEDRIPTEAVEVLKSHREENEMNEFLKTAPSNLVHSLDSAPDQTMFYTQQRALYQQLKANQTHEDSMVGCESMKSKTGWKEPCLVKLPEGDVIQIPLSSTEKVLEEEREKSVPATNSINAFSALHDSTFSATKHVIQCIPFFAEDNDQNEEQLETLRTAGVHNPAQFKSSERSVPSLRISPSEERNFLNKRDKDYVHIGLDTNTVDIEHHVQDSDDASVPPDES